MQAGTAVQASTAVRAGASRRSRASLVGALLAAGAVACGGAPAMPPQTAPPDAGKRVVAQNGVVSSANPYASEAGLEILRRGGNAVDAAVATAFAIGVVEPQMSGLGGGGGMLIYLGDEREAEYLDFYAAEPAAAFRGHTEPAEDRDADLRRVAVPGEVAGLVAAHERFGRLELATVMAPAIRLAEGGFPVNQILARMIAGDSAKLYRFAGHELMWPDGAPLTPGARLTNPALAASLRRVAEQGRDGFYRGPTASAVVAVMNDGGHPLSLAQFGDYQPEWKRPLCTEYRGNVVLSAPPPQTGLQVLFTLELLEPHDLAAAGLPTRSARGFDIMTSALRVGSMGRSFNDDPRWADVPARGVASQAYARRFVGLVGSGHVPDEIMPENPQPFENDPPSAACAPYDPWTGLAQGPRREPAAAVLAAGRGGGAVHGDFPGNRPAGGETTHISVADGEGNVVALTQTNSSIFGSGAFAAGFFLNDSGYRFSEEDLSGALPAEWRTRNSTISPTVVLRDGSAIMVAGAPGSGRIPTAIVQNMVYTLDYGLDPMEALRMPRIFPDPGDRRVQLEGGFAASVLQQARDMGYEPTALSFGYARLYMLVREGDWWVGVADPRHDGEVRGYE